MQRVCHSTLTLHLEGALALAGRVEALLYLDGPRPNDEYGLTETLLGVWGKELKIREDRNKYKYLM